MSSKHPYPAARPLALPLTARGGLFRGCAPALRAYAEHRRPLYRQSVLGRGMLIESLLATRTAALTRLRDMPWLRRLSDATYRQTCQVLRSGAYDGFLPLRAEDLATLLELPLPLLADNAVLSRPTHARAAEILPELPLFARRANETVRILADSYLDEAGTPFRSEEEDDGRLVVHGQDAPSLEALAGIAHELGHCLYEAARPVYSALGQLASERLAHTLEEQAAAQYLRTWGTARESRDWWVYQRRVDALNLHFFVSERAAMYGPDAVYDEVAPASVELLREHADAFRESLFTLPGYQVVYARASLARLSGRVRPGLAGQDRSRGQGAAV